MEHDNQSRLCLAFALWDPVRENFFNHIPSKISLTDKNQGILSINKRKAQQKSSMIDDIQY